VELVEDFFGARVLLFADLSAGAHAAICCLAGMQGVQFEPAQQFSVRYSIKDVMVEKLAE
jgi:hypothetical protein